MASEATDLAVNGGVIDADVACRLSVAHAVDDSGEYQGVDLRTLLPVGGAEGLGREGAPA